MADVTFHLEVFDGPLDLLLHLLSKNKLDIKDIPISEILEQYMGYLEDMRRLDIEITGDFIAMASQLVYIKSRMLLPVYGDESENEDPRASLIKALLNYQLVKQAGSMLLERYQLGKDIFTRERETFEADRDRLFGNTAEQLKGAMAVLLEKLERRLPPPPESFSDFVSRRQISVSDKLEMILNRFQTSRQLSFNDIVMESQSRQEVVAVFLAVLELSRTKRVVIEEADGQYSLMLMEENDEGQ